MVRETKVMARNGWGVAGVGDGSGFDGTSDTVAKS
jgi:hypothetical protein